MKKAGLLAAMRRGGRAGALLFDEVVSRASGALTPAAPPMVTLQKVGAGKAQIFSPRLRPNCHLIPPLEA
jgi:hypothetical protein